MRESCDTKPHTNPGKKTAINKKSVTRKQNKLTVGVHSRKGEAESEGRTEAQAQVLGAAQVLSIVYPEAETDAEPDRELQGTEPVQPGHAPKGSNLARDFDTDPVMVDAQRALRALGSAEAEEGKTEGAGWRREDVGEGKGTDTDPADGNCAEHKER